MVAETLPAAPLRLVGITAVLLRLRDSESSRWR